MEATTTATSSEARARAERTFSLAVVTSGIRCTLAYIVLPFVAPLLGLAPGVGPVLGLAIGAVAIGANGVSIRRFWRVQHPRRRLVTVLHAAVICFLLVLVAGDLSDLISA